MVLVLHYLFLCIGGGIMGTPIIDVYRKFLGMIEDEEWLLVEDEVIEDLMLNYLENATVEFSQCKKDLSIDYDTMTFHEVLSMNEIMILAWGMVIHYLQHNHLDDFRPLTSKVLQHYLPIAYLTLHKVLHHPLCIHS